MAASIDPKDLESFSAVLRCSDRVLALCGAGLSAASGIPTFRGAGGLWRRFDAMQLATPQAFKENPSLVWHFYNYRRHMSLQAKPNAAHYALAELARRKPGFLTLTQNIDGMKMSINSTSIANHFLGLSEKAGHDKRHIAYLHGSLFDVKCSEFFCDYKESGNYADPIVPALAIPKGTAQPAPAGTAQSGQAATDSLSKAIFGEQKELDISDDSVELAHVETKDLPQCPKCGNGLLRPGVVWFNEVLPKETLDEVGQFIKESPKIDIMMVIGTGAKVWPAAGYVDEARDRGARIAVINMDLEDIPGGRYGLQRGDWFFQGDASVIVPAILKGEIGDIAHLMQEKV